MAGPCPALIGRGGGLLSNGVSGPAVASVAVHQNNAAGPDGLDDTKSGPDHQEVSDPSQERMVLCLLV